jgi:SAM-dependent methyltransferase
MMAQYDSLARDYDALFADFEDHSEAFYRVLKELLPDLSPTTRILDCACGTGANSYAFAKHGHRIVGTDESSQMLQRARERFDLAGLEVRLEQVSWADLPKRFDERFDLVLCGGNSISHCAGPREMQRVLAGMRGVMAENGRLVLGVRNWEALLSERPRFEMRGLSNHRGETILPVYVWELGGWGEESFAELLFIILKDGGAEHRSYRVSLWPFTLESLRASLQQEGFTVAALRYDDDNSWYTVIAKKVGAD